MNPYLASDNLRIKINCKHILQLAYLLLLPVTIIILIPKVYPQITGYLLGINIGYLLIALKGFPDDRSSLPKRIIRVFIALIVFIVIGFTLSSIMNYTNLNEIPFIEFLLSTLSALISIWSTTGICIKLKLYFRR